MQHVKKPARSLPARALALSALVATFALAAACQSRLTGNEGNLEFLYPADDNIADFNKPIAVGARLDLRARAVGTLLPVAVKSASSDDANVLQVVSTSGDSLTVEGVSAGGALISVEATKANGEAVSDSVNMLARVPEVLKMRHFCTVDPTARYLVGQDVLVPFDMERTNGQPVIGYGYHPITITPAAGLTLDTATKDQAHFRLKTAATKQTVTMASTIDSRQIQLELVEQGDIDGALLAEPVGMARVGHSVFFLVRPSVAGKVVCQARADVEVTTKTPDVCTVGALQTARTNDSPTTTWGWVEVKGKAVGKCNFEVKYLLGAAGAGSATDLTVDVAELVTP